MKLYDPQTIRYIKNKYGFRFSKNLGQNFITDGSVIDAIVEGAGITKEDLVIEIGPGIGVLTVGAAERAGKVIAIEIDESLIEVLRETLLGHRNVTVVNEDVLKLDLNALIEKELAGDDSLKNVKIIGNLPYYITTPIIMKLLESRVHAESITVMMQKEVADRIGAEPGGKGCGAITAAVHYYCEVSPVADVPKEVFMPMPKVDSAVIRLDIRKGPPVEVDSEEKFFRVIRAGFSQRRKTLLNSLQSTGTNKEEIRAALDAAGIEQNRRAESLSLEEFARLANEL